jgi:hypothetical protein
MALPLSIVESLRREVAFYQLPGLQQWDALQADPNSIMRRLAFVHDNRQARENPVRFESIFYRMVAHRWVDRISTAGGFSALTWQAPIDGYDSFVAYSAVNIGRPGHQRHLDGIMARSPGAHQMKIVRSMMQVFRTNPLSLTGVSLFHAAHPRPAVFGGTFSNILAPEWVDPANPTYTEIVELLDLARSTFGSISNVDAEVIESSLVAGQLIVTVHNQAHETAFERVRTRENLPVADSDRYEPNPYKGTFTLLRDLHPTSGQENYIEITYVGGDGRPIIVALDEDYRPEVWDDDRVPSGYVAVGGTSKFGVVSGVPWSVLQVQPELAT